MDLNSVFVEFEISKGRTRMDDRKCYCIGIGNKHTIYRDFTVFTRQIDKCDISKLQSQYNE